mmetsp:Transcript_47433/g.137013  ORF Transcript_47433/g.137013 Transcript_47433/m.137013 type:complete len:245 (-) Transcript_47433:243-977(-)
MSQTTWLDRKSGCLTFGLDRESGSLTLGRFFRGDSVRPSEERGLLATLVFSFLTGGSAAASRLGSVIAFSSLDNLDLCLPQRLLSSSSEYMAPTARFNPRCKKLWTRYQQTLSLCATGSTDGLIQLASVAGVTAASSPEAVDPLWTLAGVLGGHSRAGLLVLRRRRLAGSKGVDESVAPPISACADCSLPATTSGSAATSPLREAIDWEGAASSRAAADDTNISDEPEVAAFDSFASSPSGLGD